MTVDRTVLRRLIAGWKPEMRVEIKVRDLCAVLDRVDELTAEVERLQLAAAQGFAEEAAPAASSVGDEG